MAYVRVAQLPVTFIYTISNGDEEKLFARAVEAAKQVLICWHHTNILSIAEQFKVKDQALTPWNEKDFDSVWAFTQDGEGWHFASAHEGLS